VPGAVADVCHAHVRLPLRGEVRSFNLAMAAALAAGEALRQTGGLPG
jgi:tRNA (cytidine/uridine-2'-O-)-methyltransferase